MAYEFLFDVKKKVDKRKVEKEEGEALAKEMGIPFFETSAKSNVNITEAFMKIAEDVANCLTIFAKFVKNPLKFFD